MSDVLKNWFKKICLLALAVTIVGLILYALIESTYSSTVNQWLSLSSFSYGMAYSSLPNSISLWLPLGTIFSELSGSTLHELNKILTVPYLIIGVGFGVVPGYYLQLLGVDNSYDRYKKIDAVGWAVLIGSQMLYIFLLFANFSTEILIVPVLMMGLGGGLCLGSGLLLRVARHSRNSKNSQ